ncbi:MAG: hypothetical protein V7K64_04785 [Nostoc sp.]|uniref:hypothetical protein n=1 Tax=unclassified Nostoc TaxID=2593658 RepID=UPI001DDD68A1|nr:hypothetical protein [Nostoc sp. JL34]MBN3887247.1 hypothetical protein [Nostoc sp. JL34]
MWNSLVTTGLYRCTAVEHLKIRGYFCDVYDGRSCGTTLAHCVWLNDAADIAIFAQSQSTVW